MQRIKVGVDGHVLDGRYQGSRTWLVEILRRAPSLSEELEFVVYSSDVEAARRLLADAPVVFRKLPVVNPIYRNLVVWPRLIERDGVEIFVSQYFCSPRIKVKQIPVVHDVLYETHPEFFPWRYRWRNRLLVAWSVKRSALVITVSKYTKDQIVRRYKRRASDVAIVHNGVDAVSYGAARDENIDFTDGLPYGLFVGRLEPRKNLRLALAALKLMPEASVRLIVVGRNDFEDQHVLRELEAEPRAIHLEDVPEDTLRNLYRGSAALIYPSLGEGWGVPILEALASGTPVIASAVTAIPEAGGESCIYFSPSASDAAQKLAALFTLALRGELKFDAKSAAAHVAAFNWDDAATQFVSALRRVNKLER